MATDDVAVLVSDLLKQLNTAPTSEEVDQAARELAKEVKSRGIIMLKHHNILQKLETSAKNKKSGMERESGLIGFNAMAEVVKDPIEPIILNYLVLFLDLYADKGQVVQEAAEQASRTLVDLAPPEAAHLLLPLLYEGMGTILSAQGEKSNVSKKWQTKVGALKLLKRFTERAPEQVGELLPEIIPVVSNCLADTKNEVASEAQRTMRAVCSVGGNPDIERHIKDLVLCMGDPTHVPATIEKLASTTFVAEVNGPTLAIMVPLLTRALNERSTLLLRQTVIIIDNLCKLVRDPRTAAQFLPQLYPGVDRQAEGAAFPEIRALAGKAKQTLIDAGGHLEKDEQDKQLSLLGLDETINTVKTQVKKVQFFLDSFYNPVLDFIAVLCVDFVRQEMFTLEKWIKILSPYLNSFLIASDVPGVCTALHEQLHTIWKERSGATDDDDAYDHQEGEEICRVDDFSLAYGTRLLLNHTKLKLHRGQRYGLCGTNGAGKSTLMRSIHQGKVEGFPSQDQVRTAFVDYTVQGADTSLNVVDYVAADHHLKNIPREEIEESLRSVGFDDARLSHAVNTFSGGWKMKVELARAMLTKADILLLDEPTNHLDVHNIKWLEDYLNSQTHVTCLIVSHDSGFLDNVCTQILHYEKKKLRLYSGNLSKFVEAYPAARTYYTLDASTVEFSFPKPSVLSGVRSNTKAILKITDCTYTYAGASRPSLFNASASLSLSSRVAVVGPNGAGKTTMIKLLTGESIPQTGTVWRHPALRIGYVAQHAFHHLEQHLEKTPMDYLQWRYSTGEDKEVLEKETRQWSEEERKQMEKHIEINGDKRQIETLLGRAKLKKTFQYEVKWRNLLHKYNTWISREKLLELGFQKMVQQFDDKEASREGLMYRELTVPAIRQHFQDVGLDPDIAQYSKVSELSGGQKVKVVIAAAMWNNSHMLILDEPTNFLDREALGGLAGAIKNWEGAVVMISHSQEFVSALCPETWTLEAGRLNRTGKTAVDDEKQVDDEKVKAKLSKKKKKTRNEIKKQEDRRRARHLKWLIEGGEKEPDTDSD
ncbi:P-loop containing nucleoside triphosphate hydrolase protein [Halteromyces radiatus]|uniref:P-loop containing nucleoside triphosphate hydrolase protein n=1 Tax=Halteromyces radiatus TaxID=101107 RepID=UPI00221E79C0|nr:P-loop containing nucleoside triphosphate hydrolase protein [Halteromyces radiatus]KAI8083059.1 P-loop containing nucleoside triphosphate hydrolase protein [Halteromyces radiatus]